MQKLILPINNMRVTASPFNEAYYKKFGFRHYGLDSTDKTKTNKTLYASGNGTVVDRGYDNACGNVVIIKYDGAFNHITKKYENIVFRYFHLASIKVSKDKKVTKDTVIGTYGRTGTYGGTGDHLHLETDTDTQNPRYTPTITKSNWLYGTSSGANTKTIKNPTEYLNIDNNQTYMTVNDQYINDSDKEIPRIDEINNCISHEEFDAEVKKRKKAEQERDKYATVIKAINSQTNIFA